MYQRTAVKLVLGFVVVIILAANLYSQYGREARVRQLLKERRHRDSGAVEGGGGTCHGVAAISSCVR